MSLQRFWPHVRSSGLGCEHWRLGRHRNLVEPGVSMPSSLSVAGDFDATLTVYGTRVSSGPYLTGSHSRLGRAIGQALCFERQLDVVANELVDAGTSGDAAGLTPSILAPEIRSGLRRPVSASRRAPNADLSSSRPFRREMRCRGTSRGSSNSDDLEPGHFDVTLVLGHERYP